MKERVEGTQAMRPVIVGTLAGCVLIAVAPWLSGGQLPVAMLMSAGGLLLGALLCWRQPAVRRFGWGPLGVWWLVLMGWGGLSLVWSPNRFSTVVWLVSWLLAGLAFRLAYTIAGEARGRAWVTYGYLASAVGFCGWALWMYVTGSYDRLTGTFYWANPAAGYLIPAIVLGVDGLRKATGRRVVWWVLTDVVLVSSFLLADSRGGTLVLAAVMVLYLLVMPTPRQFWIKFVFTWMIAFGLSIGMTSLGSLVAQHSAKVVPGSRLVEVAKGESNSVRDRFSYLESAFEMWFDRPLLGVGAGAYGEAHPQYQQRVVSASRDAHNLYVQILAELGLVGAVALAAVLLCLAAGVLRGVIVMPETMALLVGWLGLMLHFGLDIDASYPALLLLAAVLAGLVYRQGNERYGRSGWRWAGVAVAVLVPVVSLYQSGVWAERARQAQEEGELVTAAEWYGKARQGLIYNPDYVGAEGIELYALAAAGGAEAKTMRILALERSKEAQRQAPLDGQHHQLEGRVLMLQGKVAEAEAAFKAALDLDGLNHPDYGLDLALAQLAAGKVAVGVETAKAMLALYPPEVVANRSTDESVRPALASLEAVVGNVYLAEGKLAEARAAAKRGLALDPDNLRARALMHQIEIKR